MDYTTSQSKKFFNFYNISPSKSKGQNFLITPAIFDKIISVSNLNKDDAVLEVGPGFGGLTKRLTQKVNKVVAVELDKNLYKFLTEKFAGKKNISLINDDVLNFDPDNYRLKKYKVVANLPYQITSYFLRHFLTLDKKPSEMTLLIQKEVAERIIAGPGKTNLLSLSVQFYSQPKIIFRVSKNNFWPKPKIDSAVLKLEDIGKRKSSKSEEDVFFKTIKAAFSSPRKQIQNNLFRNLGIKRECTITALSSLNKPSTSRPQELSLTEWIKLTKHLIKK